MIQQTGNYSNKTISHELLNVLWLIAAFILLIACVNFINLSTAQAVNRAKEVGVRKVLGSNKSQLQIQFIVETFLIVTIAVILAAVITILALPYVNQSFRTFAFIQHIQQSCNYFISFNCNNCCNRTCRFLSFYCFITFQSC